MWGTGAQYVPKVANSHHLCDLLTGGVSYLLVGGLHSPWFTPPWGRRMCAKHAAVVALVQALACVRVCVQLCIKHGEGKVLTLPIYLTYSPVQTDINHLKSDSACLSNAEEPRWPSLSERGGGLFAPLCHVPLGKERGMHHQE